MPLKLCCPEEREQQPSGLQTSQRPHPEANELILIAHFTFWSISITLCFSIVSIKKKKQQKRVEHLKDFSTILYPGNSILKEGLTRGRPHMSSTQFGHTWLMATIHMTAYTWIGSTERKSILAELENLPWEPMAMTEFSGQGKKTISLNGLSSFN